MPTNRPAPSPLRPLLLPAIVLAALSAPPACVFHTGGIDDPDGLPAECGDGVRQAEEPCEGDDLGEKTCADLDYESGTLTCTAACAFDLSACKKVAACGDGIAGAGEPCDGKDLGGNDCAALGHLSGPLACTSKCELDESACIDPPANWFDVAWLRRRTIIIHHAKVAEDLLSFAVLVDMKEVGLGAAKEDGSNLVFTASDGKTKLSHEIESFSGSPPRLLAWVSVPTLSATANTVFYVYYENPKAQSQESPAEVWDASYAGVWHLSEAVDAGSDGGQHKDATGKGRDGTQHGNGGGTGKIGRGQQLGGDGDYIDIAHPGDFVIGDADCTISAWIKTSSSQPMGIVLKTKEVTHEEGDKLFGLNHDSKKLGLDQGWVAYVGGKTESTTIFGTTWCGPSARMRSGIKRSGTSMWTASPTTTSWLPPRPTWRGTRCASAGTPITRSSTSPSMGPSTR